MPIRRAAACMYRMWYISFVAAKRKETPAAEPVLPPTEGTHGKRVPAIFFHTEAGRRTAPGMAAGPAIA
jgi:hypothetical protein